MSCSDLNGQKARKDLYRFSRREELQKPNKRQIAKLWQSRLKMKANLKTEHPTDYTGLPLTPSIIAAGAKLIHLGF